MISNLQQESLKINIKAMIYRSTSVDKMILKLKNRKLYKRKYLSYQCLIFHKIYIVRQIIELNPVLQGD